MPENIPGYLFSGDRDWGDTYIVDLIVGGLAALAKSHHEAICIVEGEARGLDTIAKEMGKRHGLPVHRYPANWSNFGRRAGPVRNQQMLDEENVKIVFAFHNDLESSKGTRDMVRKALRRGITVYNIRRVEEA